MSSKRVYLGTYPVQQDMRIRLPKSVLNNLPVERGVTRFAIYLDQDEQELVFTIADTAEEADK